MHVCMYELFIVQALYIFTVRPRKARCMYVYIYTHTSCFSWPHCKPYGTVCASENNLSPEL